MNEIRLQKFLANQGICSRRKAEEHILKGDITVNGVVVTELGTKITPQKDKILFKGKKIEESSDKKVYILLNKPIGYVTTTKDQFHRDTVLELVKIPEKVLPVGRLDMYTSGALLLSNDGDFIYQMTHPKYEVEKTYNATVKGIVTKEEVEALKNGVAIDNYVSRKSKSKNFKNRRKKRYFKIRNYNT